jgi:hypothetical protein
MSVGPKSAQQLKGGLALFPNGLIGSDTQRLACEWGFNPLHLRGRLEFDRQVLPVVV